MTMQCAEFVAFDSTLVLIKVLHIENEHNRAQLEGKPPFVLPIYS